MCIRDRVYYVYNRVNNIDEVAAQLQKLLPDVTVEYAHGQMGERRLQSIMTSFINKEIDVLVSTTIIETGLDIPNAVSYTHLYSAQINEIQERIAILKVSSVHIL